MKTIDELTTTLDDESQIIKGRTTPLFMIGWAEGNQEESRWYRGMPISIDELAYIIYRRTAERMTKDLEDQTVGGYDKHGLYMIDEEETVKQNKYVYRRSGRIDISGGDLTANIAVLISIAREIISKDIDWHLSDMVERGAKTFPDRAKHYPDEARQALLEGIWETL